MISIVTGRKYSQQENEKSPKEYIKMTFTNGTTFMHTRVTTTTSTTNINKNREAEIMKKWDKRKKGRELLEIAADM